MTVGCFWAIIVAVVSGVATQPGDTLVLVEGEIFTHVFLDLVLTHKESTIQYSQSIPGMLDYPEYRPLRYNQILKSPLLSESPTKDKFATATCFVDIKGLKDVITIVYTKQGSEMTNIRGHAKYFIQQRETVYQRSTQNPLDAVARLMDIEAFDVARIQVNSEFCIEPILVMEHKRILMVCSAAYNNQFFVVNICSDKSCSERSEPLKIKDFIKDVPFSLIRTKMMPGINDQTYALLVWFEGHPFIESILFDTSGNLESEVYRMDHSIWTVRYFSGQLLLFDTYINSEHIYLYSMFEFGFKKLDMGSIQVKQTKGFGTFINSFVNSVNGQVEVELLEDRMLVQLGLDRASQLFMLETAQEIFDPSEGLPKAQQLLIFEMAGDYQLVTIAPNGTSSYAINRQVFAKFKLINRVDNFNELRNDFPFANMSTMWKKVSGFNQLRGCSIEGNSSVGFNMTVLQVEFDEPILHFNTSRIAEKSRLKGSSRMLTQSEFWLQNSVSGDVCDDRAARLLQSTVPPGTVEQTISITKKTGEIQESLRTFNLKILPASSYDLFLKWKMTGATNVVDIELMGMSSDQYAPVDKAIKGNFISVHSFETSLKRTVVIGDKVNPLLNYRTIWFARGKSQLAEDIWSVDGFFAIMSVYRFRTAFQFITYRNSDQQVAIYRTQGRNLLLEKIESTKFKANYFELYNSTIAIIQGEGGLYVFDSVKLSLRELLIDAGKCEHVLVGKHSLLDTIVWCFANSGISAYYARDLVGGQAGIRKLTVVLDSSAPIDFKTAIIRTNEYFPDIIFIMSTETSTLTCFKVETKSSLLLIEVSREKAGPALPEIRTLDFNLIEQYLMVYMVQKIGFGSKILFEFFYIQTPLIIIRTKSISLNYNFAPDYSSPLLFPLAAKRLTQTTRQKYTSTPMFLLKVKVAADYENVLYISPSAPLAETIPHTMLRLKSKIKKIKMGECLMIDDQEIKLSAVVFYSFMDNGMEKHSLVKLDESSPQIFLGTDFDNSAEYTNSFADPESETITVLNFDSDLGSPSDYFSTVKMNYIRKYRSDVSHQVSKLGDIKFNSDLRVVEMEKLQQLATTADATSIFDKTLYYLVEFENLIAGDIESWTMSAESQLEQSSQVIDLKGMVRNISSIPGKSGLTGDVIIGASMTNASCTKTYRTNRKVDFFGNMTTVACDFVVCLGESEIIFKLDLYYGSLTYSMNSTRPNNLMITDPSLLGQLFEGDIMILAVKSNPNGRNIYVDFYSIEISYRTVGSASFQTGWLTRRFFSDSTKDFLLRMRQNNSDPTTPYYEYFEFSVQKAVISAYNVTIFWELWNLRLNANRSLYLDGSQRREIRTILPQSLYNGASTMEIYDDTLVRLMNHGDDTYIWLLFETMKYDTYIVRYSRAKIYSEPVGSTPFRSAMLPDVWRLSNPYYGYDNLFVIKSRKVDWLFVQAKVISEATTRVLVYYAPPSLFAANPTQMDSLYVKESMNFSSIVEIRPEKILNYKEPELSEQKSETYKRVLFIRSNGSYISTDIYPRLEFHFTNLYIASSWMVLSAKGVRGKADSKKFEIRASRHDNFFGKSKLHGYLILLLVISTSIVIIIYQTIRSQAPSAKRKTKAAEILTAKPEDRTRLLEANSGEIKTD